MNLICTPNMVKLAHLRYDYLCVFLWFSLVLLNFSFLKKNEMPVMPSRREKQM